MTIALVETPRWPVAGLELDPGNPRLPEELRTAGQAELLRFFEAEYDLEELGWSMTEKGYFDVEPLLGIEKPGQPNVRVIIEGNRRLATLKLLTSAEARAQVRRERFWGELSELSADKVLDPVPVRTYERREDLLEYLGFRHVSGLLQWTSEAKARFVYSLVRIHNYRFEDAARVIGSHRDAIRRQFIAWGAIEQARGAHVDTAAAIDHFGVFYRALQNPKIRSFLHLTGWLDGTEATLEPLVEDGVTRLVEVLEFIFGPRRVLKDSRDLDDLGRVLDDAGGVSILRETRDLKAALDELPADRDAVFAAIRLSYRHAARATSESWQFRGDRDLLDEARRLRGMVEELQRSLSDRQGETEEAPT
jgi:hypothetical protein